MTTHDPVSNPAHYARKLWGHEPVEIIQELPYNLGCALKYVWRAGLKTKDPNQDLDKALQYLQFEDRREAPLDFERPRPKWYTAALYTKNAVDTRTWAARCIVRLAYPLNLPDFWAEYTELAQLAIRALRTELNSTA